MEPNTTNVPYSFTPTPGTGNSTIVPGNLLSLPAPRVCPTCRRCPCCGQVAPYADYGPTVYCGGTNTNIVGTITQAPINN